MHDSAIYPNSAYDSSSNNDPSLTMPNSLSRTNSGGKRKSESPNEDGMRGNKKRFIWPQALHQHFVSAVFDIGLRTATNKEVISLVNGQDNSVLPISLEMYRSHLQKFKVFRDPSRYGHKPYYEQLGSTSISNPNPSYSSSKLRVPLPGNAVASSASSNAVMSDDLSRSLLQSVNEQILQISRAIQTQQMFADYLLSSISKQKNLLNQIIGEIALVNPEIVHMTAENLDTRILPPYAPQSNPTYANTLSNAHSSRTELSMIHEMREQMNLHRQLLLKRDALQVIDPTPSLPPPSFPYTNEDYTNNLMSHMDHYSYNAGQSSAVLPVDDLSPMLGVGGGGGGEMEGWEEDTLFCFLDNDFTS